MKSTANTIIMCITIALVSTAALADPPETAMYNLPANSQVTLIGTVDQVGNEHRFVMRNDKGVIDVALPAGNNRAFKVGDGVTVTGVVKKPLLGIFGSEIQATNVELRKPS